MASNAPNYEINYNDKRFTQVESEKQAAMTENEKIYGGMINSATDYYNKQIDAAEKWGEKQAGLQQEQTDFAIEKIEQQKAQARTDYVKEQQGAYTDYKKQSNQYGVGAEQRAANGLENTGYSESAQVSMYNTYQNRVATARDVFMRANLNYDNMIKEAQLQNNAALAEIAFNTLQTTFELGLEGFKYKNDLIIQQADKKLAIDEMYYGRWQDVYNQMFEENKFAEEVRQYEQDFAQRQAEFKEKIRQFDVEIAQRQAEFEEQIRQFDEEIARLKANDAQENELEIQRLELQKKQVQQEQEQWEAEMAEEKRQFDATQSDSSSSGRSGGGKIDKDGSSGGSSGGSKLKDAIGAAVNKVKEVANNAKNYAIAVENIEELIRENAPKDVVSNSIAIALRDGQINQKQAQKLRDIYLPRGVQY